MVLFPHVGPRHAVDEMPFMTLAFNCEFRGQDLHSEPSKYKPSSHTQCVGDVEPVGAVENG
jgi:hypothetical protein